MSLPGLPFGHLPHVPQALLIPLLSKAPVCIKGNVSQRVRVRTARGRAQADSTVGTENWRADKAPRGCPGSWLRAGTGRNLSCIPMVLLRISRQGRGDTQDSAHRARESVLNMGGWPCSRGLCGASKRANALFPSVGALSSIAEESVQIKNVLFLR